MADAKISALTSYTTPLNADLVPIVDTANTATKQVSWANIKATLKTYFDTLYVVTSIVGITGTKAQFDTAVSDGNIMFDGDSITNATATAHRVFYSDGSGVITELALGADGTFLKSNGAAVAPSFATPAGSGDVSKVGTPANNQVGVWTGDGTLEGDAALTFDTATDTLSVAASGKIAMGAVNIIDDTAGTTTLSNIDALDATTEATIESAIDTLANLTSIQGRTVTLADAGANAIFGWDDVAGAYENLTASEALAATGVTSSAAELNILDGATLSTTELNYVDGVTSAIQTQLDGKLSLSGGTLTGNITLGENTSIDLDPAGSADGKYSGICITGTAGAALAFGDLIYLAVADSRWELVDSDSVTTSDRMIGMCVLAAGADGNATKILLQGTIRADANFPALTIGAAVYAGETPGDIQVAIPTGADAVIRRVGYALTDSEIYFNPSQDSQTVVA